MAAEREPSNERPDGVAVYGETPDEDQGPETAWIELEEDEGAVEVVQQKPLKVIRTAKKHGVLALLGADDADDVQFADLFTDGDFAAFLDEFVIPNIRTPTFYFDDPDAGTHDFADLEPVDMRRVITGIAGKSPDDLNEEVGQKFRR